MRDQRCVMFSKERALVFEEVQQIGHLLEVGGHVRVVAPKVDVVELDVDDVLDTVIELAGFFVRGRGWSRAESNGHQNRDRKTDDTPHVPFPPIRACNGSARSAPGAELIRGPLPIRVRKVAEL